MADEAVTNEQNASATTDPPMLSQAPDQGAAPADLADSQASETAGERHGRISSLFSSFLRGTAGTDVAAVSDETPTEEPEPSTDDAAAQAPERAPTEDVDRITLTKDEMARQVQSLVDQEMARRQKLAEQRQSEEERRRKRREDPIGYAEEEEQREAAQQEAVQQATQQIHAVGETVRNVATEFDRQILHPLYNALPAEVRDRIYGNGPVGIDGRAQFVRDGLAALAEHHRSEGERVGEEKVLKKLRSDQAFRKQLYHEFRGDSEPLVAPAASPSGTERRGDPLRDLLRGAPVEGSPF